MDITAFCYQEFVVVVEFHRLFMKVTFTVLEPADHPFIDLFPSFERSAVWAPSDKKAQLVLSAVKAEPAAGFFIDEPGPRRREIITFGRQDQPGCRRRQLHVIGHVEPARKKVGKAHFRVGVLSCK